MVAKTDTVFTFSLLGILRGPLSESDCSSVDLIIVVRSRFDIETKNVCTHGKLRTARAFPESDQSIRCRHEDTRFVCLTKSMIKVG